MYESESIANLEEICDSECILQGLNYVGFRVGDVGVDLYGGDFARFVPVAEKSTLNFEL